MLAGLRPERISSDSTRDLPAREFIGLLKQFGYSISRQAGSHIRLTSVLKGDEHHITIPDKPLKIGTINSILNDIAAYVQLSKTELLDKLFHCGP